MANVTQWLHAFDTLAAYLALFLSIFHIVWKSDSLTNFLLKRKWRKRFKYSKWNSNVLILKMREFDDFYKETNLCNLCCNARNEEKKDDIYYLLNDDFCLVHKDKAHKIISICHDDVD